MDAKKQKVKSGSLFYARQISGAYSISTNRFLKGPLVKGLNRIGRLISYTSTKSYGAFSLSFGLVTLLLHLLQYYFVESPSIEPTSLIIGALFALIGTPLIFFDKPMSIAMQDFFPTDYLFFEFFSVKRMHRIKNPPAIPVFAAIFLGIIPAVLGFWLSVKYVVLGLVVFSFGAVAFVSPEFPVILTLLALPYLPSLPEGSIVLGVMSLLGFLSYAIKVLIGKRNFYFDIYTVAVVLFGAFFAVGGLLGFGADSARQTLVFLALLLGYFPVSNLVVNRRLCDCAVKAIVFSTLPLAIYTLVCFVLELIKGGASYSMEIYFGAGFGGEASFILGAYLLVGMAFSIMFSLEKRARHKKTFYVVLALINSLALLVIGQLGAWICMLLGLIIIHTLISKKAAAPAYLLVVLPYLIPFLPNEYLDTVSSLLGMSTPISSTVGRFVEELSVFLANMLIGVGIGDSSYHAFIGLEVTRATNLLLGLGVSVGAIVAAIFVITVAIKLLHTLYFTRYVKYSSVNVASRVSAGVFCILLMYGAFGNILAYPTLFYLFFAVCAILVATMRVSYREYEDRMSYYGDARSVDSSSIDVNVLYK